MTQTAPAGHLQRQRRGHLGRRSTGSSPTHGLAVEQFPVASSPAQFASLMAGEYDAVLTSPDNVATYVLNERNPLGRRLDLQIVRAVDRGGRLSLVGAPGIERLGRPAGRAGSPSTSRPPGSPSSVSRCSAAPASSRPGLRGGDRRGHAAAAPAPGRPASSTRRCSTPGTRPAPSGRARTSSAWSATSSAPISAPCSPPAPTSTPPRCGRCSTRGTTPSGRCSPANRGRRAGAAGRPARHRPPRSPSRCTGRSLDPLHGICAGGEVEPGRVRGGAAAARRPGRLRGRARPRRAVASRRRPAPVT